MSRRLICYLLPDRVNADAPQCTRPHAQESDNLWWDSFANEFFEDDATLTLTVCLEDGPKRFSKLICQLILCLTGCSPALFSSD